LKIPALITIAIVVGLLLTPILWTVASAAPSTHPSLVAISDDPAVKVGAQFLEEVVGLTASSVDVDPSLLEFDHLGQSYLDMSFDIVGYGLVSIMVKTPTLRGLDDIVRFSLRKPYVHGSHDIVESADSFLSRMQVVSSAYESVFQEAQSILRSSGMEGKACTAADGVAFSVSKDNSGCTFTWSKQENGVSCISGNYWLSDCVQVSVDPKVGVVSFGNTWDKYEIVANRVSMSQQEAVSTSLGNVEYDIRPLVSNVKAELKYLPAEVGVTEAHSATLYPCWEVELDYSVTLPNGVDGHSTRIRADTQETVFDVPRGCYRERDESRILAPWYNPETLPPEWPQDLMDPGERELDENITDHIHQSCQVVGYDDYLGKNATANDLRYSSQDDAVFVVCHGGPEEVCSQIHYAMAGGHPDYSMIYDFELDWYRESKPKFVVSWVCKAGAEIGGIYGDTGLAHGFPFAYTGNSNLSQDGYWNPDGSDTAVLAFRNLAPFMSALINNTGFAAYHFLWEFYDQVGNHSIIDSLDLASEEVFGNRWDQCPLVQYSDWQMVLYGDGNRSLRSQAYLTILDSAHGTTNPVPDTHTYSFDSYQNVTAIPNQGYHLDSWQLDRVDVGSMNPIQVHMNADHLLVAIFAKNVSLQLSVTAGGTTDPPPDTYYYGNPILFNVTAIPYAHYHFDRWLLGGATWSTEPEISFYVDDHYWLHAVFEPDSIAYQVLAAEGGTTIPDGQCSAPYGSEVYVYAFPSEFYEFDRWTLGGNNVSSNPAYHFTITQTVTLQAFFEFVGTHDVAVTSIVQDKNVTGQGYPANVTVTVENQGDKTEQVVVTLCANSSYVDSRVITLDAGESRNLTFTWDTEGFSYGLYLLNATAQLQFADDDDTGDNTRVEGCMLVTIAGDVDGDHDVDIFDVVKIASCYGTEKGQPGYVANYDINDDGKIDIFDVVIANGNYGQHW
jgi:hypothetical protein